MKLLSTLSLLSCLFGSLASYGQSGRTTSEAATTEQRIVEDIGVEQLSRAIVMFPNASYQNISDARQTGVNNKAIVTQQTLSALNQAYIVQVGNANGLNLAQSQGGNIANVTQDGNGNTTGYNQKGQNNVTSILQKGNGNKIQGINANSDFLLQGDNNIMKISQDGSNNTIKGEVVENKRLYEIRQTGSYNTLTQIETSAQAPKGYIVEMRGQGINLTIQQGQIGR